MTPHTVRWRCYCCALFCPTSEFKKQSYKLMSHEGHWNSVVIGIFLLFDRIDGFRMIASQLLTASRTLGLLSFGAAMSESW